MKTAVVASGFGGDKCEYPFAVFLAKDQVCAVEFGQPTIDLVEVSEGSLVDEESSVLLKRVRVRGRVRAGGGHVPGKVTGTWLSNILPPANTP
jgi:hypothetical protein